MKVTCSLPNASELISGVTFARQDDGTVVATGVSADAAAQFSGIPGYVVVEDGPENEESAKPAKHGKAKTDPS